MVFLFPEPYSSIITFLEHNFQWYNDLRPALYVLLHSTVQLERSLEDGQRHYSIDAGFRLPSTVSIRVLGLLKQRGPEWSSAVRVRYGLQGKWFLQITQHFKTTTQQTLHSLIYFSEDSQNMQECHMTQNLHSESDPVQTYHIAATHELHCSHFINLNHKVISFLLCGLIIIILFFFTIFGKIERL